MMKNTDNIIIGCGIIGLATARQYLRQGQSVILLEAQSDVGLCTSFHNSAVVHAGIYYPEHSLKLKMCMLGRRLLKDYCKTHDLPYYSIGKLIVATSENQLHVLEKLHQQSIKNGVRDIQLLTRSDVAPMEPGIRCTAAMYSPSTAVIDARRLMFHLKDEVVSLGGVISTNTRFIEAKLIKGKYHVKAQTHDEAINIKSQCLINSAGIDAPSVAKKISGLEARHIPKAYFAKGNFFKYNGPYEFNHLVYPLPEAAGLGIHTTRDIFKNTRFGPDIEWLDKPNYEVNLDRKNQFLSAIEKYFPSIEADQLIPEFVGIRAKIAPPEEQPQDFIIQSQEEHGLPSLINLFGIESPGLSAAFGIAEYVTELSELGIRS